MRGRNISLIALAIAALAIFLAIGLFIFTTTRKTDPSPTPQPLQIQNQGLPTDNTEITYPTEVGPDWEVYANTKYGYSIKYPPNWATIINVTPTSSQETLDNATSLDIFDSAAQKSYPDGVMTISILDVVPNPPSGWSQTEANINGSTARKFVGEDQGLHMETYLIPQNQGVLQIEVRFAPGDQIQETFAAMLQTFQPTK
ncbi:MAG: hypothetical protein Q8P92_01070 [Candidatus Daviesbacteria bacterium]|nr:hypothetical protein [Candidatus Daviesbacteria bacterium]